MRTDEVLRLMVDVAERVVNPRFRALASYEVMEKARPGDLVTVADREAEVEIAAALTAARPHAVVVGEEAVSADPSILARLADADEAWTIDPIDGTRNFVRGSADHAVMLAEILGGAVTRAWIWQPQKRTAYVAERGEGLWVDGARVARPSTALAATGGIRGRASRKRTQGTYGDVVMDHSSWCCGVDYPALATGETEALAYAHSMPWDHAPGSLMVTEQGGVIRHDDGRDYDPRRHGGALLAARSPQVWDRVRAALGDALP